MQESYEAIKQNDIDLIKSYTAQIDWSFKDEFGLSQVHVAAEHRNLAELTYFYWTINMLYEFYQRIFRGMN